MPVIRDGASVFLSQAEYRHHVPVGLREVMVTFEFGEFADCLKVWYEMCVKYFSREKVLYRNSEICYQFLWLTYEFLNFTAQVKISSAAQ